MKGLQIETLFKTSKSLSQINNINNHKWKKDQTIQNNLSRSKSLLARNKLAKSFFSLNDTSFSKMVPLKAPDKLSINKNNRKSAALILQKYNRENVNKQNKIQRVNSQIISRQRQPSIFFDDKNQNKNKLLNQKINQRNNSVQNNDQVKSFSSKKNYTLSNPNNKFKLLFKQEKKRLSVSQRKIVKLDKKISQLKFHREKLERIKPIDKKKEAIVKPKPAGVIVSKQKITKLIDNLISSSQSLFNTFLYPKKVGSKIKHLQGFNSIIKQIFMEDDWRAKRIADRTVFQNKFWIFKPQSTRIQYFGEQDHALYVILNNFHFRMQKAYSDQKINFSNAQFQKVKNAKFVLAKQLQKFQKKSISTEKMSQITKFVENRRIHNQQSRQKDLSWLQKLGVRFNITERTKGLVLTQRENAMKGYKLEDFKGKNLPF